MARKRQKIKLTWKPVTVDVEGVDVYGQKVIWEENGAEITITGSVEGKGVIIRRTRYHSVDQWCDADLLDAYDAADGLVADFLREISDGSMDDSGTVWFVQDSDGYWFEEGDDPYFS